MFTLTSQDRHGILLAGHIPSVREQSGRVYDPNGLSPTLSTMQGGGQEPKIKQAGNSVTVNVIEAIAKQFE